MKNLLIYSLICFFCLSCISEIDFELTGESRITIGGLLSNSSGEREIRVRLTDGLDSLSSPIEATGFVMRNGDTWVDLISPEPGILRMPEGAVIEAGNSYSIEIQTRDGQQFRSAPQLVQPTFQPDSLSFDIIPTEVERDDGTIRFARLVRVFAHLTIPELDKETLFFKWHIDNTWAYLDWRAVTCYINDDVSEFPVTLLEGREIQPGNIKVLLTSRELGDAFIIQNSINTYLHMLDEESFRYYEDAQRLDGNQGAIFDEIPALIEGNITQIGEREGTDPVLGFVEFSLADTTRLPIARGDFTFGLADPCENFTCPPPAPDGSPSPCACRDCGDFFGRETEIQPLYW